MKTLNADSLTLCKEERIHSKKQIEKLFNGGQSHSIASFPLRVVYLITNTIDEDNNMKSAQASIMVSVSKRHFKRAVKRNRVKRQLRESYRHNKNIVLSKLNKFPDKMLSMAFIWLDDNLRDSTEVNKCMVNILNRLGERL